jgi:hypothetical protein
MIADKGVTIFVPIDDLKALKLKNANGYPS